MDESRTLESVGSSTGGFHSVGHAGRTTGEGTDLGEKDVLLLQAVKEGVEVRTTKVGDCPETGEERSSRDSLEVTLSDVQHGGTEIELVKELSHKDVYIKYSLLVSILTLLDDVSQPFILALGTSDPDKIDLLALDMSSNVEPMNHLLQDRSKWSNSNTSTNEDGYIISVPVLVSLSKWSIEVEFRERDLLLVATSKDFTEVVGPRANCTDVETDVLLMRSRRDSEWMILSWVLSQRSNTHPLASLVVEGDWTMKVDTDYTRWEDIGTYYKGFDLGTSDANDLINDKDDTWSEEEVTKERILHKTSRTVQEHEDVEDDVPAMSEPESLEGISSSILDGKDVYHYSD